VTDAHVRNAHRAPAISIALRRSAKLEIPRSSIIDTVPEIEAAEADEQSTDASVESVWDGRLAAFRAMRHRNFRLFFCGQLISLIGTWMQSVAQAWLVLKLTNSAMALGLVAFSAYFPMIMVGCSPARWSIASIAAASSSSRSRC
jgi:hypothetical protein